MKRNTQQLKFNYQVRRDIRMVHNVNSGHPGSLGCTEFMVALYQNLMDAKKVLIWTELEDLFFLSNGHIRFLVAFCQKRLFSSF
jgi:transketolase